MFRRSFIACALLAGLLLSSPNSQDAHASASSGCPNGFQYALEICGNNDFTRTNGVVKGSGTSRNPYVIDGLLTHPVSIGIFNTNSFFILRNWITRGQSSTLALDHVVNGQIQNITVFAEGLNSEPTAVSVAASKSVSVVDSNFQSRGFVSNYPCPYGIGMSISDSSEIRVASSIFNGPDEGLDISSSTNITLFSNAVKGGQGGGFCGGGGAFGIGFSSHVDIAYNSFIGVLSYGALAFHDSDVVLFNNTFAYTVRTGLSVFDESSNIMIFQNTFLYNGFGLRATGINVTVYHNNFLFNEHQAFGDSGILWDNGYPDGGNYWSNYYSPDHCRDTMQSACSSADGIGDVPYKCDQTTDPYCGIIVLGASVEDHYPLMKPFGVQLLSPVRFAPVITQLGPNYALVTASVELAGATSGSNFILSSIRLNARVAPIQASLITGKGPNGNGIVLVAQFNQADLHSLVTKPGLLILSLTCNFLTESNFDQLTAIGNANFLSGLARGSQVSLP